MTISTISPAYGRDYKSKKEVQEAFDNEKDFIIEDFMHPDCGRYVNKQQLVGKQKSVFIRYKSKRQIASIKITPTKKKEESVDLSNIPSMTIGAVLKHKEERIRNER